MPSDKFDRAAWLAKRKRGLGSSDAAAILGLSHWKTRLHVQAEKLGEITDDSDSELLELGLDMEPVILKSYERKTGVKPRRVNRILTHPKYDWMLCSLDAQVGSPSHPLEVKHVLFPRGQFGAEGTDEIPTEYVIQGQHQLAVTGAEFIEFPVLLYGKLRIYRTDRNERLIGKIIDIEREFWERNILGQEPVGPDFDHPETLALIQAIHGVSPDKCVELGADAAALAGLYLVLGKESTEMTKKRDRTKAELLSLMGDAELATLPCGIIITRKKVLRKGYNVEPSEYVKFTVKQNGGNEDEH